MSDGKECCCVFYHYLVKKLVEKEIGLFIGCEKKGLEEGFFINSLNDDNEMITDSVLTDIMISN